MMDSPSPFSLYQDPFLNSDYLQFPPNNQFVSPSSPRLGFGSLNLNSATGAGSDFAASPYPSHAMPMSFHSSGNVTVHGGPHHGGSNAGSGADSNGRASPLDAAFGSNTDSPYLHQAFHHAQQQRLAGAIGISPPLTHMSSAESLPLGHSQSLPLSHHSHFPAHLQGRMSPSGSSGAGSPGPAYTVAPSQSHGMAAVSGAMDSPVLSEAFAPGSSLPRSSLVHRHQRGYSSSSASITGGAGSRSRSSQRKRSTKAESDDEDDLDDADFKDSKDDKGDKGPGSTERRREEIRRQRIESEQRRRDELRDGYRKLKDVLPTSNQKSSKVSLLDRATQHIKFLDETQKQLTLRLQQAESETHRLRQVNETLMLSAAEHRAGHPLPAPPPPPHPY